MSSKTLIDKYISDASSIFSSSTQSCPVFAENLQNVEIVDAKGNVIIKNVNWSQISTVHSQCLQHAVVNSGTQSKLKSLTNQTTLSLKKLNPKIDSTNISTLTTELESNITNTFTQNCSENVLNEQIIRIKHVDGNVIIQYVQWDQAITAILKCVQIGAMKSDAYRKLMDLLNQSDPPSPDKDSKDKQTETTIIKTIGVSAAIGLVLLVIYLIVHEL